MKKSWLLVPIAFSAFVATWGGWVSLAKMTGFGKVNLLPGLVKDASWSTIDLSISLPLGVEAYAALALAVAFDRGARQGARWFAGVSAALSLTLAAIGQATVHNLEAAHRTVAPSSVTSFVSVLPVAVLGMASALAVLSQGRVSEPSRGTSRWSGIAGRLAEAAASRAEKAIAGTSRDDRDGTWDDFKNETRDDPAPTSPGAPGTNIPAGQKPPSKIIIPTPKGLDKDPGTLAKVRDWLSETPKPTVDEIASRLETSRSTAGRIAQAARTQTPAEPGN